MLGSDNGTPGMPPVWYLRYTSLNGDVTVLRCSALFVQLQNSLVGVERFLDDADVHRNVMGA